MSACACACACACVCVCVCTQEDVSGSVGRGDLGEAEGGHVAPAAERYTDSLPGVMAVQGARVAQDPAHRRIDIETSRETVR